MGSKLEGQTYVEAGLSCLRPYNEEETDLSEALLKRSSDWDPGLLRCVKLPPYSLNRMKMS